MNKVTSLSESHNHNTTAIFMVVFIILISFFLGLHGLVNQTITRDEQTTLGHIGGLTSNYISYQETINSLIEYSPQHPPLYFLILNTWGNVFTFAHNLPMLVSVFFGVLALAVIYRLGCDIGGQSVGFYSVLILATSVVFVYYTHELRQYSAYIFWNGLVLLVYYRLVKQRHPVHWMRLALLIVATTAAIYTHYSSIFMFVVIGLYHLFFVKKSRKWWYISGAMIFAGILFLPWLPIVFSGIEVTDGRLDKNPEKLFPNSELLSIVPLYWGNGHRLLLAILATLGGVAVLRKHKGSRDILFFCVSIIVVILVFNEAIEFIKKLRYLLVTLVPFYIFGGMGLAVLQRYQHLVLIFFVIWVAVGAHFQTSPDFHDKMGMSNHHEFLEYNALISLAQDMLDEEDLLILVVRDFRSIKQSKQETNSIHKYYLQSIQAKSSQIHSSIEIGEFRLGRLLEEVDGRDNFWLTYRYDPTYDQIEFIRAIHPDYLLCKDIEYGQGNLSHLQYYLKADHTDFEQICELQN